MWYLQAALKNVASLQVVAAAAENISTDRTGKCFQVTPSFSESSVDDRGASRSRQGQPSPRVDHRKPLAHGC